MANALTLVTLAKLLTPIVSTLARQAVDPIKKSLANWSAESGIKNIARTLIRLDKVKTIWSPEKELSLSGFYYPSRILVGEDEERAVNNFSDLPHGNLVVEGIVGQGKSIFMRFIAVSIITGQNIDRIPIYIELRNLSAKRTLVDLIQAVMLSLGVKGGGRGVLVPG